MLVVQNSTSDDLVGPIDETEDTDDPVSIKRYLGKQRHIII